MFDTFDTSSSWIHPGVSQLLLSLDQFDTIRYAAYRLSTKLLTVQQVPFTRVLNFWFNQYSISTAVDHPKSVRIL